MFDAKKTYHTRFAPSPTGTMHLGNLRAALLSFLLAKKHSGSFILRIEDTDQARNTSEALHTITDLLRWTSIKPDQGPEQGGAFGPYKQSERNSLYTEALSHLVQNNFVYRCFCSKERIEELYKSQSAQKLPPRYDRKCFGLASNKIEQKLEAQQPFVWRFCLNPKAIIVIQDLVKGQIKFEMKNFADFTLTRPDGSFTFLFTNFVDDMHMQISCIVRGQDHLSNSALQATLAHAFQATQPTFWHLPMLCDQSGAKLSKRHAHFNVQDLRQDGFLPEAIINYLATLGQSLEQEVLTLPELIENFNPSSFSTQSNLKYSEEKLRWFNQQWMNKLETKVVLKRLNISYTNNNQRLASVLLGSATTLSELASSMQTLASSPALNNIPEEVMQAPNLAKNLNFLTSVIKQNNEPNKIIEAIKAHTKAEGLKIKDFFLPLRYACTGQLKGLSSQEIFTAFATEEIISRLEALKQALSTYA